MIEKLYANIIDLKLIRLTAQKIVETIVLAYLKQFLNYLRFGKEANM